MAPVRVLLAFLMLHRWQIFCQQVYQCEQPSVGEICRMRSVMITTSDDIKTVKLFADQQFVEFVDGVIPDFGEIIYKQIKSVTNLTITNSSVEKLIVAPTLVHLNASMNNLTHIKRITNEDYDTLRVLILSHNAFDQVMDIKDFVAVEILDLSDNKLISLNLDSFARLTKLRKLDLSRNKIRSLDTVKGFRLDNLTELQLVKNHLFELDIARWNLPALTLFDLSYNMLPHLNGEDIRQAFPKLKLIGISRNQWNCRALTKLADFLTKKSISFTTDHSRCLAKYIPVQEVCCFASYGNYVVFTSQRDVRILQRDVHMLNDSLVMNLAAVRDEQSVQIANLEKRFTTRQEQMARMKDRLQKMAHMIDGLIEELYLREMEGEEMEGLSRQIRPIKVVF